jgi:hypothetical protein
MLSSHTKIYKRFSLSLSQTISQTVFFNASPSFTFVSLIHCDFRFWF